MARISSSVTPADRVPFWKKLWGTPRLLDEAATDEAFEEFEESFVPSHMHKIFTKSFGGKTKLDNRFFVDEALFHNWDSKLQDLVHASQGKADVIVIYGSPDRLEAHFLKGELRRSLRDIVKDDWQAACAIVRAGRTTLYLFVDIKMRGCLVRTVQSEVESELSTE